MTMRSKVNAVTSTLAARAGLIMALSLALPWSVDAAAQQPPQQPVTSTFADEDRDWGVAPTTTPRRRNYHAPTPRSIPGAKVIKTLELKSLMEQNKSAVVIDVQDLAECSITTAQLREVVG